VTTKTDTFQPVNPDGLLSTARAKGFAIAAIGVLGVLLLLSPTLFFIAIVAALVSSTGFVQGRIHIATNAQRYLPYLSAYATWSLLAIATAWMAFSSSLPVDDLLRHIQAAGWGFNYVPHYRHHILPTTWSWTIAFDAIVGRVHAVTGDALITARVVRAAETAFVGTMLLLAINRATKHNALRFFGFSLALFGMVWGRLQLGRPEIVFTGLVFGACFLRRGWWLALFAGAAPAYAFSPVYAAACLLLGDASERPSYRLAKNLAAGLAAVVLAMLFWFAYTGGEYVKVFSLLNTVLELQAAKKIWVGELLPIVAVMSAPISIFILGGFFFIIWRQAESLGHRPQARMQILLLLAVAFYFSLPNYVRYTPIIWSLFVIAGLHAIGDELPKDAPASWLWIATILFVALNITPRGEPVAPETLKAMRVPPGSRVLAPFNRSSYIAVAANPDAIVTPIFDISAVTEPARTVVLQLTDGKFSCPDVQALGFDYLIENTLNGPPPSCLTLIATQGPQRLWKLNKQPAAVQ
jgi:hypothetical protein